MACSSICRLSESPQASHRLASARIFRVCEGQRSGQGSSQVHFEELNLPAVAELEVHIDPMGRPVVTGDADSVRRRKGE
jgi:hypothetical protein